MITVSCNKCGAGYRIDEAKIPPGGGAIRCQKCGERFPVSVPAEGAGDGPTTIGPPPTAAPTPSGAIPLGGDTPKATSQPSAGAIPLPAASAPKPAAIAMPAVPPATIPLPAAPKPATLAMPSAPVAKPAAIPLAGAPAPSGAIALGGDFDGPTLIGKPPAAPAAGAIPLPAAPTVAAPPVNKPAASAPIALGGDFDNEATAIGKPPTASASKPATGAIALGGDFENEATAIGKPPTASASKPAASAPIALGGDFDLAALPKALGGDLEAPAAISTPSFAEEAESADDMMVDDDLEIAEDVGDDEASDLPSPLDDLAAEAPVAAQSSAANVFDDMPAPLSDDDDTSGSTALSALDAISVPPSPTMAPAPSAADLQLPRMAEPDDLPASAATVEHFDGDGADLDDFDANASLDDLPTPVRSSTDSRSQPSDPDDLPAPASGMDAADAVGEEEPKGDGMPEPVMLGDLTGDDSDLPTPLEADGDDMPTPLEAEGDLPDVDDLPRPKGVGVVTSGDDEPIKQPRKRVGLYAGIAAAALLVLGGGGLVAYQQAKGVLPWQEPPPPPPPPKPVKPLPPVPDTAALEGKDLGPIRKALAVLAERKAVAAETNKTLGADEAALYVKIYWRALAFNGETSFEAPLKELLAAERSEPAHPDYERADAAMALLAGDDAAFADRSDKLLARDNGDPDVLLLKAANALRKDDAAKAVAAYEQVLAVRPKSVDALMGLARVDSEAKAPEWLKKALAAETDNARLALLKAELSEGEPDIEAANAVRDRLGSREQGKLDALRVVPLAKKGRLREATALLDSAIAAGPSAQLLRHRAWLYLVEGKFAESAKLYDQAATADTAGELSESILVGRVLLALRQKDLPAAKAAIDAAAKAKVDKRTLAYAQGLLFEADNKLPAALKTYGASAKFDKAFALPVLAAERLASKKLPAAARVARLQAIYKKYPDARVAAALGDAYSDAEKYDDAATAYAEAFAKNPWTIEAPEVLKRRLTALDKANRTTEAAWLRAMNTDVDVTDPAAGASLLRIGLDAKDADLVERTAKKILELRADDVAAKVAMAEAKALRGDKDGARDALNKINKAKPSAMAFYALAKLAMPKDAEGGRVAARKAIDLDDKKGEYHLIMADALVLKQRFDDAREEFNKGLELDPTNEAGWVSAAKLALMTDRKTDAAAAYEKAVKLAPEKAEYYVALGGVYFDAGDKEKAAATLQNALKKFPGAHEIIARLGKLQQDLGNRAAAMKLYQQALKISPNDPQVHYYLGYLYKDEGHNPQALREFEAYLQLNPSADDAKDIKAEIDDLKK